MNLKEAQRIAELVRLREELSMHLNGIADTSNPNFQINIQYRYWMGPPGGFSDLRLGLLELSEQELVDFLTAKIHSKIDKIDHELGLL